MIRTGLISSALLSLVSLLCLGSPMASAQTAQEPRFESSEAFIERLANYRDGKNEMVSEAALAIERFTGRDLGDQLVFDRELWDTPIELLLVMRTLDTDEEFTIRYRDWHVVRWDLGTYTPELSVDASDQERYEMEFMRRFCPDYPISRLIPNREPKKGSGRVSLYSEQLSDELVSTKTFCRFSWSEDGARLTSVMMLYEPARVRSAVQLTADEALESAREFVRAWPGVETVTDVRLWPPPDDSNVASMAYLVEGEEGVQRPASPIDVEFRMRPGQAAPDADPDRPVSTRVFVDVQTGACFAPWASSLWPERFVRDRLSTSIYVRGVGERIMSLFEARFLEGVGYICARLLDSHIWWGTYAREGDEFTIVYADRMWNGRAGDRALISAGGSVSFDHAPVVIEEEIYRPTSMVERITGWTLECRAADYQDILIVPPGAR